MKFSKSRPLWIDGQEEEQELDTENLIPSRIRPTTTATSPTQDTSAQATLRAELRHSDFKVCYQSRRDGNSELCVMDADGATTVNLTRTARIDEIYPHVSNDGKRICFTVVRIDEPPNGQSVPRFDVYRMGINRSGRALVVTDATDPCWNPTGDKIAFVRRISPEKVRDFQNAGLFVHDIDAGETEELTEGKLYHAYVPWFW
jgi:hypothetical protein